MSIEKVKQFFSTKGIDNRILELEVSCATVELAAKALNCESGRIAKSLSFRVGERIILIVASGDGRVDNGKYKKHFGKRPKMLLYEETKPLIGHSVGGICPFAINDNVEVYLDCSLQRFKSVFPACGSSNSLIELTIPELEKYADFLGWVDVCRTNVSKPTVEPDTNNGGICTHAKCQQ